MPKYKSHIRYSLLPGVCFDSGFVEVLISSISSITPKLLVQEKKS